MKFVSLWHLILRLPYLVLFAKLKFLSRVVWKVEIWPRHSYLTPAFIPGRSDLDVSAYISNQDRLSGYLGFYNFNKALFPFLGELCVYTPEIIELIKQNNFNGFELERDPIFLERFNISVDNNRSLNEHTAISYLMMALFNDFHKLEKKPFLREKKWQYHFDHVNSKLKAINPLYKEIHFNPDAIIYSVLTAIANLTYPQSYQEADKIRCNLRLYFSIFHNSDLDTEKAKWIHNFALDPSSQSWIYFFEFLYHKYSLIAAPRMTIEQFKILSAQINWFILKDIKALSSNSYRSFYRERLLLLKNALEHFSKSDLQYIQIPEYKILNSFLEIAK